LNESKFKHLVNKIQEEYDEVREVFLLDPSGNIIFKSEDFNLEELEAKEILNSWKNRISHLNFMGDRFAIVKWAEIQLAAKNMHGKGSICGSITPEGDFFIAHIKESKEQILLIEWSIMINKLVWEK
jgi:hypothetical protein